MWSLASFDPDRMFAEQKAVSKRLYDIAASCVYLTKSAASPRLSYSLAGRLVLSESGWALLEVPNSFVRGAFDALHELGSEMPPGYKGGPFKAHITVMRPEDITKLGGPDKLQERGKLYRYTLGPLREVEPKGWEEMSKCWFIEVKSPELEKLRRSYGLSSLPSDGKHPFHITVGVKRKHILKENDVKKAGDTKAAASKIRSILAQQPSRINEMASQGFVPHDYALRQQVGNAEKRPISWNEFFRAPENRDRLLETRVELGQTGSQRAISRFNEVANQLPSEYRPLGLLGTGADSMAVKVQPTRSGPAEVVKLGPGRGMRRPDVAPFEAPARQLAKLDGPPHEQAHALVQPLAELPWAYNEQGDRAYQQVQRRFARALEGHGYDPFDLQSTRRQIGYVDTGGGQKGLRLIDRGSIRQGFGAEPYASSVFGMKKPKLFNKTSTDLSHLPYRERSEIYPIRRGSILTGLLPHGGPATFGGGVDPGEHPSAAAVRELLEETGYKVKNVRSAGLSPIIHEWSGPEESLTPKQRERRTQFRGEHNTFWIGDVDGQPTKAIEPSSFKDIRFRKPKTLLKLLSSIQKHGPYEKSHTEFLSKLLGSRKGLTEKSANNMAWLGLLDDMVLARIAAHKKRQQEQPEGASLPKPDLSEKLPADLPKEAASRYRQPDKLPLVAQRLGVPLQETRNIGAGEVHSMPQLPGELKARVSARLHGLPDPEHPAMQSALRLPGATNPGTYLETMKSLNEQRKSVAPHEDLITFRGQPVPFTGKSLPAPPGQVSPEGMHVATTPAMAKDYVRRDWGGENTVMDQAHVQGPMLHDHGFLGTVRVPRTTRFHEDYGALLGGPGELYDPKTTPGSRETVVPPQLPQSTFLMSPKRMLNAPVVDLSQVPHDKIQKWFNSYTGRPKEAATHHAKAVRVERRDRKDEVWLCPHCGQEILEKSLYCDKKGWWFHRPCFMKGKGSITLPDKEAAFKQETNASCGPAAVRAAANIVDHPVPEEKELRQDADTTPQGGSLPTRLAAAAREKGIHVVEWSDMTIDDLISCVDHGKPVVVPLQMHGDPQAMAKDKSGHYITIFGYDRDKKLLHYMDPATGKSSSISHSDFEKNWHDRGKDGQEYVHFGLVFSDPTKETKPEHNGGVTPKMWQAFRSKKADGATEGQSQLTGDVARLPQPESFSLLAQKPDEEVLNKCCQPLDSSVFKMPLEEPNTQSPVSGLT